MIAARLVRATALRRSAFARPDVCVRALSYPAHSVVGMPSLSPTMSSGTISKWCCKVGDKVSAGDALAEVETDKATMTFESQDEFVIAKFLVEAGAEVKVGSPILVTVEDAASVDAFASFTVAAAPVAAPAAAAPAPKPAPKVEVPKPPTPTPAPAPVAAPAVPKVLTTPTPAPAPKPAQPIAAEPVAVGSAWGQRVVKSPLAQFLAAQQQAYNDKYGHGGHSPIPVAKAEKKDKAAK